MHMLAMASSSSSSRTAETQQVHTDEQQSRQEFLQWCKSNNAKHDGVEFADTGALAITGLWVVLSLHQHTERVSFVLLPLRDTSQSLGGVGLPQGALQPVNSWHQFLIPPF